MSNSRPVVLEVFMLPPPRELFTDLKDNVTSITIEVDRIHTPLLPFKQDPAYTDAFETIYTVRQALSDVCEFIFNTLEQYEVYTKVYASMARAYEEKDNLSRAIEKARKWSSIVKCEYHRIRETAVSSLTKMQTAMKPGGARGMGTVTSKPSVYSSTYLKGRATNSPSATLPLVPEEVASKVLKRYHSIERFINVILKFHDEHHLHVESLSGEESPLRDELETAAKLWNQHHDFTLDFLSEYNLACYNILGVEAFRKDPAFTIAPEEHHPIDYSFAPFGTHGTSQVHSENQSTNSSIPMPFIGLPVPLHTHLAGTSEATLQGPMSSGPVPHFAIRNIFPPLPSSSALIRARDILENSVLENSQ